MELKRWRREANEETVITMCMRCTLKREISKKDNVQKDNDCFPELTKDIIFGIKLKQGLDTHTTVKLYTPAD